MAAKTSGTYPTVSASGYWCDAPHRSPRPKLLGKGRRPASRWTPASGAGRPGGIALTITERSATSGLDFGQTYGEVADGLIHVHHRRPLSDIGEGYIVDPITDLIPVCPNCHAVMHLRKEPYGVEDIKGFIASAGSETNATT